MKKTIILLIISSFLNCRNYLEENNFKASDIIACYRYECIYDFKENKVFLKSNDESCKKMLNGEKLIPLLEQFERQIIPALMKGTGLMILEHRNGSKKYLQFSKDFQGVFIDLETNQTYLLTKKQGENNLNQWREVVMPEIDFNGISL